MTDQRKYQRFELRLPIELVRKGAHSVSLNGETKNMSSGGVLFTAQEGVDMEVGEPIEYLITLPAGASGSVRLKCIGKVARKQGQHMPSIAATLERYEFVRQSMSSR